MGEWIRAAPEMFLVCAISVILVVDVFLPPAQRRVTFYLTMLALLGTALCSVYFGAGERTTLLYEGFVADPAGNALKLFAYAIVAIVFLYSCDYLEREGLLKGEYFILGLFALLGIMVMISANSLLILYLGLELLSLALYALVAFDRESSIAAESAMKYFVLGAIASRHAALRGLGALRHHRGPWISENWERISRVGRRRRWRRSLDWPS